MAISKARLEELIEKEATIWAVYDEDRMERIKLVVKMMGVSVEEYNKIHNCEPMLYSQFCGIFRDICPISWLFETEEEAVFYKEFSCIERPIKLDLPNWEEINKDNNFYYIRNYNINKNFSFFIEIYNFTKTITLRWNNGCTTTDDCFYRVWELTKENYTIACRKAKELFLGENNDKENS